MSTGPENDFQRPKKPVQKRRTDDPLPSYVLNAEFNDPRKAVPKVSTHSSNAPKPTSSSTPSSSYKPVLAHVRKPKSRLPLFFFILVLLFILGFVISVLVYFFQFYYKNELPPLDNSNLYDKDVLAMRERIRYLLATRIGEYQCNESPLFYMTETEFRSSFEPSLLSLPNFEEKFQEALASLSGIIYKGNLGYEYSGDQPVLISNLCKQFLFLEEFVYPNQTLILIVGTALICYLVVQGFTLLDQRSKEKKDRKTVNIMKHGIKTRILAEPRDIETIHEEILPALNRHIKEEELWRQACYELSLDPAFHMSKGADGCVMWRYLPNQRK